MGIKVTTAPTVEPVTATEAKAYARVTITADDTLIDEIIKAARLYCEKWLRRKFITQTLTLKLDGFPSWEIELPYPPLIAISSVGYTDTNGASQTVAAADYDVDTYSEPGRLTPGYGEVWPTTRDEIDAVTIVYTAGYGAAATSVPEDIKIAIKLLVNQHYEQRLPTEQVMKTVHDLLDSHRYGEYFSTVLAGEEP